MFVWVHSNVFIYTFQFLISHKCTKIRFSNKKTVSFHERLCAMTVTACSIAKASNGWALTDVFLQCKIFQGLAEAAGQSEVTLATCRSAALSCTPEMCVSSRASESSHLLVLKQAAGGKTLTPPFHTVTCVESSTQIKSHDKLKKEGFEDFSTFLQRMMMQCYHVSHFQCNYLAQKYFSALNRD